MPRDPIADESSAGPSKRSAAVTGIYWQLPENVP